MSEAHRISDQLKRAMHGEAWHGPSIQELLAGVTAEQAAARPVAGGHSIWELVLHITTWERTALRRLRGEATEPTDAENWPVAAGGEAAWQEARAALERGNAALADAVRSLSDAELLAIVPGERYSVYVLLHGVVQHDLYHGGQIALLKKA